MPVSTAGSFYAVATEDAEVDLVGDNVEMDLSRVYQLPQLLRLTADPLPVKVQLVCGPIQHPLPSGFSGERPAAPPPHRRHCWPRGKQLRKIGVQISKIIVN